MHKKPFILIAGPPGVGKMTVGQHLCARTGYRLFHNHSSIELALQLFDYGMPGFGAINEGIRQLVFKTVAQSPDLPGFVFTLVWAFDQQEDWDYVDDLKTLFQGEGWAFYIVELYAPLAVRMRRNDTPNRLRHKPSKQDVERSLESMQEMEGKYKLNTEGKDFPQDHYLRIDNTHLGPEEAAERIMVHFQLC